MGSDQFSVWRCDFSLFDLRRTDQLLFFFINCQFSAMCTHRDQRICSSYRDSSSLESFRFFDREQISVSVQNIFFPELNRNLPHSEKIRFIENFTSPQKKLNHPSLLNHYFSGYDERFFKENIFVCICFCRRMTKCCRK